MTNSEIFRRIGLKHHGAVRSADQVKTVVLGSSHGDCGFAPRFYSGSYNLCSTSQDLLLGELLYGWATRNLSALQEVILFYSVFSAGFEICKSTELPHARTVAGFFGIELPMSAESTPDSSPSHIPTFSASSDYRGYLPYERSDYAQHDTSIRARQHLRYSAVEMPECPAHVYFQSFAAVACANRHSVCLVIPPAREDYRREMPTADVLFGPIKAIASALDCSVLNFFNDPDFLDNDFGNADHLYATGAEKLTKKVLKKLRQ